MRILTVCRDFSSALSANVGLGKSEFLRPIIATLLGRGVLWAEGEEHRIQRKLIAPAFTYGVFWTSCYAANVSR